MDLKNKEVIGYEVSKNIDSELCKRALDATLDFMVEKMIFSACRI